MPSPCAPDTVPSSLLRLPTVVALEAPLELGPEVLPALALWQARPGDILTGVDPAGQGYRLRLLALTTAGATVVPFTRLAQPPESPLALTVAQALPARERFELVLEKLTELGVQRIVPLETARSSTRAERDSRQKKSHRWPAVLLRAARQCRRARVPELTAEQTLAQAVTAGVAVGKVLILSEQGGIPLAQALVGTPEPVSLCVGPEGGWTSVELAEAAALGAVAVSLGGRILRTETAAIAAAALVQHLWGDLGRNA